MDKEEKSIKRESKKVQKKIRKETQKVIREEAKDQKPRELTGDKFDSMYGAFCNCSFSELEEKIIASESREERAFFRALLNLKLQIEQEKIIGEVLL